MTSLVSHAFSLVLYYLTGILIVVSVDDLCIFEYLIHARTGTNFDKSWCSEKEVRVGCTG